MRTRLITTLLALSLTAASAHGQATVDHTAYDRLLRQHVVDGFVDYDAFARDKTFTDYLAAMERVDPATLSTDERIAYWINLYNAWTIRLITSHNEKESIRNISRTLGFLKLKGPWIEPIVKVKGRTLSLDQVQHEMIRRETTDPRIHFALSCGAVSCPPLRSEAYTGTLLELQLHDQGRAFLLGDTTRNRLDMKEQTFYRNEVFRYFASDFGETGMERGAFLAQWYNDTTTIRISNARFRFRGPPRDTTKTPKIDTSNMERSEITTSQVKMLRSGTYRVVNLPFDWSLNSVANRNAKRR